MISCGNWEMGWYFEQQHFTNQQFMSRNNKYRYNFMQQMFATCCDTIYLPTKSSLLLLVTSVSHHVKTAKLYNKGFPSISSMEMMLSFIYVQNSVICNNSGMINTGQHNVLYLIKFSVVTLIKSLIAIYQCCVVAKFLV